jgi:hypothetical protein
MTPVHSFITPGAALVGLAAALLAIIWFYSVNGSDSVDTLLSWSCRWEGLSMTQKPNWAKLCRESHVSLYLSILLIPVEVITLVVVGFRRATERDISALSRTRKGSPTLSVEA